jgi:hypothetical protein
VKHVLARCLALFFWVLISVIALTIVTLATLVIIQGPDKARAQEGAPKTIRTVPIKPSDLNPPVSKETNKDAWEQHIKNWRDTPAPSTTVPSPPPKPKPIMILPPVEYDRFYEGDLILKFVPTLEQLRNECNQPNNHFMLACSYPSNQNCLIIMVEDKIMRAKGWNLGLVLRHEMGHCNGWPGDHAGQRAFVPKQ